MSAAMRKWNLNSEWKNSELLKTWRINAKKKEKNVFKKLITYQF